MSDILRDGIIIYGVGGLYLVRLDVVSDDLPEYVFCSARGVFRKNNITPVAGDHIIIKFTAAAQKNAPRKKDDHSADEGVVINEICPRTNDFIRPPLANLDTLFVVISSAQPRTDTTTADKLIAIAEHKDVTPVIVITKSDLDPQTSGELADIYSRAGFEVFAASGVTGEGVEALRGRITSVARDERYYVTAFSGASGAGKSTLMNALFPTLRLATAEVSRKIGRGRHTTRAVTLYQVDEARRRFFLADTPGFSMLDFTDNDFIPLEWLPEAFREFEPYLGKCRWTDCTHLCEDGCAVVDAVERGEIPKSRHDSYVKIYSDIKAKPEWARAKDRELSKK